jgi:hypothetical protein
MASGYDISASVSESATLGSNAGSGTFTVGDNSGLKWLPLALVALGALALWFWSKNKK